jgi:putative transposase
MEALSRKFPLAPVARALGVPRSSHYRKLASGPRTAEDAWLTEHIQRVFTQHKKRYGSPRIHLQLRQEGISCGIHRVARLMKNAGLVAKMPKRKAPRTTDSRHGGPVAPNLLKTMKIDRANHVWVMDITYIPQGNGWAYLAAVLDLHLHKVVGWAISGNLHAEVVCSALRRAQKRQGYPKGVVVHSDRGCQYASKSFLALCEALGCIRSMSAKGNCYDNAAMESFFGVLKREDLNDFHFDSIESVRAQVFEYIETYYNRIRIHTALGMSPQDFETQQQRTPSAEFSPAWVAPMVGGKMAGEKPPRPRPMVATPGYPAEGCSPAVPASVSPDNSSIQHQLLEIKR